MSLGPRLLQAMVAAGGDAVVLHTGDFPYVAAGRAEIEIGTEFLTSSDIDTVLEQLLPKASLRAFNRLLAIRYECPPLPDYPGQRFTVVAYREADELWVEIRRDSSGAQERPPDPADAVDVADTGDRADTADLPDMADLLGPADLAGPVDLLAAVEFEGEAGLDAPRPSSDAATSEADEFYDSLAMSAFDELWPDQTGDQTAQSSDWRDTDPAESPEPRSASAVSSSLDPAALPRRPDVLFEEDPFDQPAPGSPPDRPVPGGLDVSGGSTWTELEAFEFDKLDRGLSAPASSPEPQTSPPAQEHPIAAPPTAPAGESEPMVRAVPPQQAVVLPMARRVRNAPVEPLPDLATGGLVHLLRTVAARGGSALYIASDAQPLMRIDGEMQPLDEVDPLSAVDIETLLLGMMPERTHEALRTGERTEWISEVPGLGRVRCVSFWDHRGAGGIFRLMTARVVSAEQLGLAREVQALALQPEGLVLIAGPRSSGKSTLISALVDLINRLRRDHVITIESEIQVVHESRGSMISQREVRGEAPGLLTAISTALREDPDVLVIEELRGDGVIPLVLDAARSGRLVIAGLRASSTADAVDRVFDRFGQDQRQHAQLALAESLRGIIVQTLLRKPGGGRVAAREVLLNTPAVASLIADGRTSQLALAIEAGRRVGMMSLNESMVALVKSGAVDASEAYRRAGDRQGLIVLLKRHGVDTTLIERLA